jgi:hypothetical protein
MGYPRSLIPRVFWGMEGAKQLNSNISAHLPPLYLLARYCAPVGPLVECGVGKGYSTIGTFRWSSGGRRNFGQL